MTNQLRQAGLGVEQYRDLDLRIRLFKGVDGVVEVNFSSRNYSSGLGGWLEKGLARMIKATSNDHPVQSKVNEVLPRRSRRYRRISKYLARDQ